MPPAISCAGRLRSRLARVAEDRPERDQLRKAIAAFPFWLLASLGLGLGYLASMMLGFFALQRRGSRELLSQVPLMPFYWLLISGAAYRASWLFATDRFT